MADFTYCPAWSGIVYVPLVVDAFSQRKASGTMTTSLVLDALNMLAHVQAVAR